MKKYHILFLLSFLLLIFSFLGKWVELSKEIFEKNIIFLLDISKSMWVQDVEWETRIDVSKKFIENYLNNYPNNKYSLIAFSGETQVFTPLVDDTDLIKNYLISLSTDFFYKWWNDLPNALDIAYKRFNSWEKSLIVLSDFENPGMSESERNSFINWNNFQKNKSEINVFLIWVWTKKWWKILHSYDVFDTPIYETDQNWNEIVSVFDKENLDKISTVLDSQKFILNSKNSWKILEKIQKKSENNYSTNKKNNINFYIIFSFLSFLWALILNFYELKNEQKKYFDI